MPAGAGDEAEEYLVTETEEIKIVSEYSGFDFEICLNLGIDTFKLLFRDAFVYRMKQTEKGREYLENAWMLKQTEPDRKRLRKRFGKEGEHVKY